MKRTITALLALICLSALLLQGCTTPQATLTPTPSATVTSTPQTGASTSTSTPTPTPAPAPTPYNVTLSYDELYDKMMGGWIGQMVGVAWAASTEFCYAGRLMPAANMPKWSPSMINNAFPQDDLYVEIPFLDAMKEKGADCDPSHMATKFKNSQFALWHANGMGRTNLKNGIPYPQSGSYLYNYHCDDIDWQIECDFLGMMYPGYVSQAAERAFEVGHIMNYGDGVYGGVFVTAMHSAAFTANSIEDIWKAGIAVIPEGTEFRELLDDIVKYYQEGKTFEQNWQMLEDKWSDIDICPELPGEGNIDAKLNSGYILLGLLYGEGDFEKTILLSTRCGQDSDCNPSSAASILGNYYGASKLDEKYKSGLDRTGTKFSYTNYNFEDTVNLNFSVMEEMLEKLGATKNEDKSWTVTVDEGYKPVKFEQIPDGVFVYVNMKASNNAVTFVEVTPYSKNEKVLGYSIDLGDGNVFNDVTPISYQYEKAGTYQVVVKVTGDKGTEFTYKKDVKVTKNATTLDNEIVVCSVSNPMGGGSKNINVIRDGKVPNAATANDQMQYDTYILGDPSGNPDKDAYIGYVYREKVKVSQVVFTEGNHFGNGGWFKNGSLKIEVFVNGKWVEANVTCDKAYPNGNSMNMFGKGYETFTFTLDTPVECNGIRLFGTAGGAAGFISVAELEIK